MRLHFRGHTWLAAVLVVCTVVTVALTALPASMAFAANPIITNRFVADPSAHVFGGRMHIYATDDQTNSGTYWDSADWRGYSSTDLVNWSNHGSVFAINGGFRWASSLAWAPAAASRNGFYYLYLPVDRTRIGVARSSSPSSGFTDVRGTPLVDQARDGNVGDEPIDPMVFTDDDGQSYLYFGTRVPKVVRLGADMMSTTGGIQNLTVSGNNYAEAPSLHKRNGIYYFTYSTGWPGQIAYATATSPLGPFTYRGIVLDYTNISTNHQSIVQYDGQWYIVYHRNALPGGGDYKRSIAIDHLYHNPDGTIRQVVPSATGVAVRETLTARHSGKLADVAGGSVADNADTIQWPTNGGRNQQWQFRENAAGDYTIRNSNSGRCLQVRGASGADGAIVVEGPCGGAPHQVWRLTDTGGGYLRLAARHSGKCLDVQNAASVDGAPLIQWSCTGGTNQQWIRRPG